MLSLKLWLHNEKMSLRTLREMFRPSEQLVEEAFLLLADQVRDVLVELKQKYDILSPLRSALLQSPRANLSQVIESEENLFQSTARR